MADPETLEEYNRLSMENLDIDGMGADVVTYFPCPGCAAKHWRGFPITAGFDEYESVQAPETCLQCGRTFRFSIKKTPGGLEGTILQVGGNPPPSYLEFPIRFS